MDRRLCWTVFVICELMVASPAFAQNPSADVHYQKAVGAREDGKYDDALEYLEQAYRADPKPMYIHERILVLERMGEFRLALDVLDDYRDELVGAPNVQNLAVLEQRLRQEVDEGGAVGTADAAQTDVLGWSLVGGGTALVAGSVATLFIAEGEAEKLRCSDQSNADKAGCSGAETYDGLTAAQFDEKRSSVTTYRVVGASLGVVGAAALGWGIYRLVGSEASAQPAAAASESLSGLRATFDAQGRMGLELTLRF